MTLLHAIALAFGGLGAAVVLWAVWGEHACGRPRCPRCWYLLPKVDPAAGATCPECGTAAAGKRLFRTRRRWRVFLLGAAFVAAALVTLAVEKARRDGPISLVPTTVLIWGFPEGRWGVSKRGADALLRRMGPIDEPETGLWAWQERYLARRCIAALRAGGMDESAVWVTGGVVARLGSEAAPAVDLLLAHLPDASRWEYHAITGALYYGPPATEAALPTLLQLLDEKDPSIQLTAIRALERMGQAATPALPALRALAAGDHELAAEAARKALHFIESGGP